MSVKERLRFWLDAGHEITPGEALTLFGTMRLGARIYELKRDGYPIESRMVEVQTRDGRARVSSYRKSQTQESLPL